MERSKESLSHHGGHKTEPFIDVTNELVNVLHKEVHALQDLIRQFPPNASQIIEKILATKGRVVLAGSGKSGIVARKLVATFASMGTPAFFLHPSDAIHGDLGMVQPNDLCIILSKSGAGEELERIIPFLRSQGNQLILISCYKGPLHFNVDLSVILPFQTEACELNLAPTSSSTMMMAFGDALAVVVSKFRSFSKADFARLHPGGTLGKNLLLKVTSLMHSFDKLPVLNLDTPFKSILQMISAKNLGVGLVVDDAQRLLGIITDGDLRRACSKGEEVFSKTAKDIMTIKPKVIAADSLAYRALEIMEDFAITSLVVVDDHNRVTGLVHIHELVKAGIQRR